jgi:hypothetical protein
MWPLFFGHFDYATYLRFLTFRCLENPFSIGMALAS